MPDASAFDPFALWRQSTDQWLASVGKQLEQALHTPEAAATGGRLLDSWLNIEKPFRERTTAAMQGWLELVNMPSRTDLVRLASQLNDANARLDGLQELVESIADQLDELAADRLPSIALVEAAA